MVFNKNNTFTLFLFLGIGGLVSITLDPTIILIYFIILAFYLHYKKYFNYPVLIVFIISFLFLYPITSNSFSAINERVILLSAISIVFFILHREAIYYVCKNNKMFKRIVVVFFVYGTSVYLIALVGFILNENLGINIFDRAPLSTSHIINYINTIPLVFLAFIPPVMLNNERHFENIFNLYIILLSINVFFAFLQYFYGIQIIDESYSTNFRLGAYGGERRLFNFSYVDPLGFGRMISFPVLLLFSIIMGYKNNSPYYFIIFIFSIIAILFTFGRTTYISTIAGVISLLFIFPNKIKLILKYTILIISIIIIVIYTDIPMYFSVERSRLALPMKSMDSRIFKYQIALSIIKENPFLGATPGGMPELSKTQGFGELGMVGAHSLYFQSGVDYGAFMIVVIFFILFYFFLLGIRLVNNYKHLLYIRRNKYLLVFLIASTAHTLSIIIHGITENVPYEFIFLNIGYIIAAKIILEKQMMGNH